MAGKPSYREGASLFAANNAPVFHTTAKPAPSASDAASPNTPAILGSESGVGPAPNTPHRDGLASRRTFTDLTAHPRFAHDPKYHWLVGVLDYSKIQDAWILRYASVEEDDRYGGSVTLHRPGQTTKFKNGQLVRVEGYLINPDSQQLRPAFQVQTLRPVEH